MCHITVYMVTMEVSYYCLLDDNGGVILLFTWRQWMCHTTVYMVTMDVSYYCLHGDNGGVILLFTW